MAKREAGDDRPENSSRTLSVSFLLRCPRGGGRDPLNGGARGTRDRGGRWLRGGAGGDAFGPADQRPKKIHTGTGKRNQNPRQKPAYSGQSVLGVRTDGTGLQTKRSAWTFSPRPSSSR